MKDTFSTSQSASKAFEYIVDFSHINEWDHTIVSANKVGNAPVKLGTRFELLYAMGKRKKPISYQVTDFTKPTKAVLTGVSKSFTAIDTVCIEELEKGCLVDWHTEITFTGVSAFIVPLIAKKIKANGLQTIRDLNVMLDGQKNKG
jgi:hypothetical protein